VNNLHNFMDLAKLKPICQKKFYLFSSSSIVSQCTLPFVSGKNTTNFHVTMLYRDVVKKDKKFCYIYYLIVVIKKDKYDLLSLLHLKFINIYTYNFNLYKISFIIYTQNFYKLLLIIYTRSCNKKSRKTDTCC